MNHHAHQTADCNVHGPQMPFVRTPRDERDAARRWMELTNTHGFRDESGAMFMCHFCWMEWKYGGNQI